MEHYVIRGERSLCGDIRAGCGKNAALPILAACVMARAPVAVDVPALSDVENMLAILRCLGCQIQREKHRAVIDPRTLTGAAMPRELSKTLRSSIFMMGPLVARFGQAEFTYPGGCEIGLRPIDIHINGLKALGCQVREAGGQIYLQGKLSGARFALDYPSVGATENLMMAACLAEGVTQIENAAAEPEVADLADFLRSLGAKIYGAGQKCIVIHGVKELSGGEYTPICDRIVAGTYLVAAAVTGGDVLVRDARPDHLAAVIDKLSAMGCELTQGEGIRLRAKRRLKTLRTLETGPYPGFPTDLQAQFLVAQCVGRGAGTLSENVFENRFHTAGELSKMGADIVVRRNTAFIVGVPKLHGAQVQARDLRGGAALVLAGLCAQGETKVAGVEYILRGYEAIDQSFASLGADIQRK